MAKFRYPKDMQPHVELAKKCKDGREYYARVIAKVGAYSVCRETQNWFSDRYAEKKGETGSDARDAAIDKFVAEAKSHG